MRIVDTITSPGPLIPNNLIHHIKIKTCCQLSIDELKTFQTVLLLLSQYIQSHPLPTSALCIVVFTDQLEMRFQQEADIAGQSLPLATIWMKRIRQQNHNLLLALTLTEEICHTLYQVYNEYKVKEIVFEVLRPSLPDISLHSIFPSLFDEDDHRIPDSEYPLEWINDP